MERLTVKADGQIQYELKTHFTMAPHIFCFHPWVFPESSQRWNPDRATTSFGIMAYSQSPYMTVLRKMCFILLSSLRESIKLARDMQRLGNLKAIPGNWLCFYVSLTVGMYFGFLCNQQVLGVFICIVIFHITIYIQKRKTGLWPFGFAPLMGQVNNFPSNRYLWKKMKMNLTVQLISSVVMLSLCVSYVDILEFRDKGFWWVPIASGASMGLALFIISINSNNYYRNKYSVNNNE
jgi:hypothetical protein